ncbi:MAG: hypothetical protein IT159_11990 [Bryobacterales bacterium]|nr:hypothetical protein [Bryobacterales bacterium]
MTTWIVVTFSISALLALLVLYFSGPKAWYWHVLAAVAALAIGLAPTPPKWNTPMSSLVVGSVFVFLMVWAVAAPFLRKKRR